VDEKPKILIASVLKPVHDIRAFYKIGCSLAQTNKYDVNIIGFDSKKVSAHKNITTYPIYNFKRLSWKRLLAPFKLLKILIKVKPEIIIANTPEILKVIYVYKILFGAKLIYDIQENYTLNLRHGSDFPTFIKPLLLLNLYLTERISKYFVDCYFLAESIYKSQLKFLRNQQFIILENKVLRPATHKNRKSVLITKYSPIRFIITGTLGASYGTLEGIAFYLSLKKLRPDSTLKIIGFAPNSNYLRKISDYARSHESIEVISQDKPIEHARIIAAIKESDVALLPYNINDNLKDRIPTKLYEYMAYQLPMIIPNNAKWLNLIAPYPAGIAVDFTTQNVEPVLRNLEKTSFYNSIPDISIYWDVEEKKLLNTIISLT